MKTRLIVLSAVVALVLTASAYAAPIFPTTMDGITFNDKNCGNCGEENVLFGHPQQGPALTIQGTTVHTDNIIDFVSPTGIFANGGQSDIDPCTVGDSTTCHGSFTNGSITRLNISVSEPGGFFHDLILDPQKLNATGDLQATVHLVGGGTVVSPLFGDHLNGDNFMTITTTLANGDQSGDSIVSVDLTSTAGFDDLKQPRISGVNGVFVVPEPTSMMMLGSGLLILTQVLRRKLL